MLQNVAIFGDKILKRWLKQDWDPIWLVSKEMKDTKEKYVQGMIVGRVS
jgi:hypothetical protein